MGNFITGPVDDSAQKFRERSSARQQYTEQEVSARIKSIFQNRTNDIKLVSSGNTSEADTLGFNTHTTEVDDREVQDLPRMNFKMAEQYFHTAPNRKMTGGGFVPRRDRYSKYAPPSLDELKSRIPADHANQTGGGQTVESESESNLSEYMRFRQYMLEQRAQRGGNIPLSDTESTDAGLSSPYRKLVGGTLSESSASADSLTSAIEVNTDAFSATSITDDGLINQQAVADSASSSDTIELDRSTQSNQLSFYNSESSSDLAFRHPMVRSRF